MFLCYRKPAEMSYYGWENQALPLGNGKIGVKVFGGHNCELLQFNEKSLWTGGPAVEGFTHGVERHDNGKAFREIQKLLSEGKNEEARKRMVDLQGNERGLGAYQAFGSLYMMFGNEAAVDNYVRDLDLDTASAMVSYKSVSGAQNRHYFVSYPDNVFVGRIVPTDESKITFDMYVVSEQKGIIVAKDNTIKLTGTVNGNIGLEAEASADKNDMQYACVIKVITEGGETLATKSGHIYVKEADSVVIIMSLATDYKNEYPHYKSGEDPVEVASRTVEAAAVKGFKALYKAHLDDYQAIYNRVQIDLGQEEIKYPTDYMLKKYKRGGKFSKELEALMFQYGRYLLISSSRDGSLPANLQGIWNAVNNPSWNCDYHLNVNLQMNYWPALTTNLFETTPPLIDYIEGLLKPGRYVANTTLGIGENLPDGTPDVEKATGWMVHTLSNPLGFCGPGSSWKWGWAPANGAWLMQNIYDCYAFTRDIDLLEKRIYPIMEECALLWSQILAEDKATGRLVSSPSFSPEHGPVTAGNTYDQTIVYGLYTDVIDAAHDLIDAGRGEAVNKALIKKLEKQLPMLKPFSIGKDGQIKEWFDEDKFDRKFRKLNNIDRKHRHISHLVGVYPYQFFTKEQHDLCAAAKHSLVERGNRSTGWAMAMRLLCWARLGDGGMCASVINEIFKHGVLENMWGTHPPFQIDGNFGFTAGIAEMLVQSTKDCIYLLPAMPPTWRTGKITGIKARGNFTVDVEWENFKLKKATILSVMGGKCSVFVNNEKFKVIDIDEETVAIEFDDGHGTFETEAGKTYYVVPMFETQAFRQNIK